MSICIIVYRSMTNKYADTATVDYDSGIKARHLFRLAAMTEVPISVAESEMPKKDSGLAAK